MPIGFALGTDILNYAVRGVAVPPPTELYLSVGTIASGVVTEMPNSGRVKIPLNLGTFRPTATSVGKDLVTDLMYACMPEEKFLRVTPVAETANPVAVLYKTPTGGDPYYFGTTSTWAQYTISGDLWSLASGLAGATFSTTTGISTAEGALVHTADSTYSAWFAALTREHFFRGYDAFGENFSTALFPNLFLKIRQASSYSANMYSNSLALPRSTGGWTAPALDANGRTFIQNVNPLVLDIVMQTTGTTLAMQVAHTSGNAASSDIMFAAKYRTQEVPSLVTRVLYVGDTITFPAGLIKLSVQ